MRLFVCAAALFGLSFFASPVRAQEQGKVLITEDFESGYTGWSVLGDAARLSIATDPEYVKSGKASLKYEYALQPGELSALVRTVEAAPPTDMKTIRFWAKASGRVLLVVALDEHGGGRYIAQAFLPSGTWQQVELSLSDFVLSTGKDDPKDPNGKLDIDKVASLGFIDMSQILISMGDPDFLSLLGLELGQRTIYIDLLRAESTSLPSPAANPNEMVIDSFIRPFLGWFFTGAVEAQLTTGEPLKVRGMKMSFVAEEGKIAAAVRMLTPGKLASASALCLTAAADKATTLLVQVEETSGGKYNGFVALEDGRVVKEATIKFSEMTASDDSKDDNGKLDPGQIKQLVLIDGAFLTGSPGRNALWVGNVRARR